MADIKAVLERIRAACADYDGLAEGVAIVLDAGVLVDAREALAASQAEVEALRYSLIRFGKHSDDCRTRYVGLMNALPDDCSCGLWVAIGKAPYEVEQRAALAAAGKNASA